ncbi:hypothetical protein F4782DRAFT_338646 [Xylaria castorea]|nr:hypothetical protein F4782DRAFT_338646 [Xylaria castorea]
MTYPILCAPHFLFLLGVWLCQFLHAGCSLFPSQFRASTQLGSYDLAVKYCLANQSQNVRRKYIGIFVPPKATLLDSYVQLSW